MTLKRKFFLILFYGFANHLPNSYQNEDTLEREVCWLLVRSFPKMFQIMPLLEVIQPK